jgi:hypothetical protein
VSDRIDLRSTLSQLAIRRPVFHSEADFQHELAWQIRSLYPDWPVRLERPLGQGQRGATDLVIKTPDGDFGLEVKYMTKGASFQHDGEAFHLKHQGAHDIRRYDICKDIRRMELFNRAHKAGGAVVALTNDAGFWNASAAATVDLAFRIWEGRTLAGELHWAENAGPGTTRNREQPITLEADYVIRWQDYSALPPPVGRFRYMLVHIS